MLIGYARVSTDDHHPLTATRGDSVRLRRIHVQPVRCPTSRRTGREQATARSPGCGGMHRTPKARSTGSEQRRAAEEAARSAPEGMSMAWHRRPVDRSTLRGRNQRRDARRVLRIVRRSFGRSTNRGGVANAFDALTGSSPSGTLRSAPRAEANGCHVMWVPGPCAWPENRSDWRRRIGCGCARAGLSCASSVVTCVGPAQCRCASAQTAGRTGGGVCVAPRSAAAAGDAGGAGWRAAPHPQSL